MTFCLGIKVAEGLIGIADTRIVRGSEHTSKAKLSRLRHADGSLFFMTSGLRSVRDKAAIYFEEALCADDGEQPSRVYQVANLFGKALRRVRDEDGDSLRQSGLTFNLHAILGGRLPEDPEPQLLYIYPEGNWVEATIDTPYHLIGRTSYGRPILDRLLTHGTPLGQAVALAYLAFDATYASVTDVDFPIDYVVMDPNDSVVREQRFDEQSLAGVADWWQESLRESLSNFPLEWAGGLLSHGTSRITD